MALTLRQLRARAISHSLFAPTTLKAAIARLGFVQADPIRAPARAQDLILRHRVNGYRAGDLEQRYPSLDLEEDLLYAYGFLPRKQGLLLHPRSAGALEKLDRRVLEVVRSGAVSHPKELEAHFGEARVVNAWGGYSRATKRALERLHYRGLLRVSRRESGVRVYQATAADEQILSPEERVQKLVMLVAAVLAPSPERTLQSLAMGLQRRISGQRRRVVKELLRTGELESAELDGLHYVWPAAKPPPDQEPPRRVRFLAPFDPVVWDRIRFEHLWSWSYRFEAYTPAPKRVRGYYALPLLWRDAVVGWANASVVENARAKKNALAKKGALAVEVGFVQARPRERDFSVELAREIAALGEFLGVAT